MYFKGLSLHGKSEMELISPEIIFSSEVTPAVYLYSLPLGMTVLTALFLRLYRDAS
jgi:hypothetical protein